MASGASALGRRVAVDGRRRRRSTARRALAGTAGAVAVAAGVAGPLAHPGSAGPPDDGVIVVVYNHADPRNSKMYLNDGWVTEDLFRTGSGTGISDTCVKSKGPAPIGLYKMSAVPYHSDNKNWGTVQGRAWRAEDKVCWDAKTWRTELFIHTEETPQNTQGGSEARRWDGTSDYASAGCWKVARANNGGDNGVARLDSWWHSKGGANAAADTPYGTFLSVAWQ